jgi:predicted DCC family thiol-disulfide oxidoreductase YuxK
VNFVLRRDGKKRFRFAALRSPAGMRLRQTAAIPEDVDSIVLIENGRAWIRSEAVLRAARGLGRPWSFLWAFIVVPRFIRDAVYDLIAANRLKWFGRSDQCRAPTESERARFMEQ